MARKAETYRGARRIAAKKTGTFIYHPEFEPKMLRGIHSIQHNALLKAGGELSKFDKTPKPVGRFKQKVYRRGVR